MPCPLNSRWFGCADRFLLGQVSGLLDQLVETEDIIRCVLSTFASSQYAVLTAVTLRGVQGVAALAAAARGQVAQRVQGGLRSQRRAGAAPAQRPGRTQGVAEGVYRLLALAALLATWTHRMASQETRRYRDLWDRAMAELSILQKAMGTRPALQLLLAMQQEGISTSTTRLCPSFVGS